MKISNKRKLQQIAFNHSSGIGFDNFVNDTTLWSDNPSKFRKNLVKELALPKIQKVIMPIDERTEDEKMKDDIHRETAIVWTLPSGKIDKYEYLTGELILQPDQNQLIEQATFT